MNHKQLTAKLAQRQGRDTKDITSLLTAMTTAIRERCSELDTVAIPGFGNFEPTKHDERISTDLVTGMRMLLPPEITIRFTPSSLLRKKTSDQK
jgi:nucleoid DNA-binding protein